METSRPSLNWTLYPAWEDARLGYAVAPHLIDAADHGVPQHRERLFLVHLLAQPAAAHTAKAPASTDLRRDRVECACVESD